VELRIGRSGRIECIALRRSSASELLDRYVLSAVRLAQPFAALPPQVASPSLPVSATCVLPG
jgi:TonB family protein